MLIPISQLLESIHVGKHLRCVCVCVFCAYVCVRACVCFVHVFVPVMCMWRVYALVILKYQGPKCVNKDVV